MKNEIHGYLFDLDGTITMGDQMIDGADHIITTLQDRNIPFRFVTNTTSKPRKQIVEKLRKLGLDIPAGHIFTAPAVAARFLETHGLVRCYFLLKPSLLADLPQVIADDESPQAVVLGDLGDDFTYNKLNRAFRFIEEGAEFITLARNRFYQKPEGRFMDVGCFVAALEYATRTQATCIGKPSKEFFQIAARSMGLEPGQLAMVGDDLENDVLAAQSHGFTGIAVRTGKFHSQQLKGVSTQPDLVLDSVSELDAHL